MTRTRLDNWQRRDAVVERWLRDEVVPVAAAMQANPSRAIPANKVFDDVRALHVRRSNESE